VTLLPKSVVLQALTNLGPALLQNVRLWKQVPPREIKIGSNSYILRIFIIINQLSRKTTMIMCKYFSARGSKAVICNQCATSWYKVCREFVLEAVFKYQHIYYVKFITSYCIIKSEIFICPDLCLPHICGRLRSVTPSPISTCLHSIGYKRKLIN
jgi:hypothetical protein